MPASATATISSVWADCLEQVAARIVTLGLPNIGESSVRIQKEKITEEALDYGITVAPTNLKYGPHSPTTRDDNGYGCAIVWLRGDVTVDPQTALRVSDRITKAFHMKRLEPIVSVYICTVHPGPVLDEKLLKQHTDCMAYVVRCWSRETRD